MSSMCERIALHRSARQRSKDAPEAHPDSLTAADAEPDALRGRFIAAVSRLTPDQLARAIEIGRRYQAEAGLSGGSAAAEDDRAAP